MAKSFRIDPALAHDPRIQALTAEARWAYIALLAAEIEGVFEQSPPVRDAALTLRTGAEDLHTLFESLSACGLWADDAPVWVEAVAKTTVGRAPSAEPKEDQLEGFEDFWNVYPRKVKKSEARRVWASRNLASKAGLLIADVRKRKQSDRQWLDGFVPHPTTYLRGDRWLDEIQISDSAQDRCTPADRILQ